MSSKSHAERILGREGTRVGKKGEGGRERMNRGLPRLLLVLIGALRFDSIDPGPRHIPRDAKQIRLISLQNSNQQMKKRKKKGMKEGKGGEGSHERPHHAKAVAHRGRCNVTKLASKR